MSDADLKQEAIEQSKPKLEWRDYYMGSLKAPLANGAHYLINLTASGGGLQARYSDGLWWMWAETFDDGEAAKQACEDHLAAQA